MRQLTVQQVIRLHERLIVQSGGSFGVRDWGALHSCLAQPTMTFDGRELYATLVDKAAALSYSLIKNYPFVDGNKRIGHAAMEIFLLLNGVEISASVDEQEEVILAVASGSLSRAQLTIWLQSVAAN